MTGPAKVARAKSSALLGCWLVTAAKVTPFSSCGTAAVPFPGCDIDNSVYTGLLSWLTQPMNSCLPCLITNGVCVEFQLNSICDDFAGGCVLFEVTEVVLAYGALPDGVVVVFPDGILTDRPDADKAGKIGMGSSTGQDPGIMNGRARLYAYMPPMPV
jgi:hypothetical protein